MSEPSLVDGLVGLPLVQAAVIIASAVAGILLWLRGEKNKTNATAESGGLPPGSTWFFDGPIIKALETLQGCYRVLTEIRTDNQRHADDARRRDEENIELMRELLKLRRRGN